MFAKHTALAAAVLLACTAAQAQVGVTADLGTTGAGAHVVIPMETYLNARLGANYFTHDFSKRSGGIDYDIKGKLQTVDLMFDWYLNEGAPMRFTAGVLYNGNTFDAHAKPGGNGAYTLNGHSYTAADVGVLSGVLDYRKAAPYVGIGWGNALKPVKGWNIGADLGVFYQGNPNVQLASIGCTTSQTVCKTLAADVAAERQQLRDDMNSLKFYPVARVSIGYTF